MQLHHKIHFFNLLVNAIAAIVIYIAGVTIFGAWLEDILENEKASIAQSIKKDIAILDELLISIEKRWDDELSIALPLLASELGDVSTLTRSQLDNKLLSLKAKYKVSDVYLIDSNLVIFASTFKEDVGLDLKKYSPEYTAYLQNLLGIGQYSSHRVSISENNRRLKKFAYYSYPSSEIIVHADIDVKDRLATYEFDNLSKYIFGHYLEKVESKYRIIEDINLLMLSQSNQWSMFEEDEDIEPQIAQALFQGEVSTFNSDETEYLEASLMAYSEVGVKPVIQIQFKQNPNQLLKNQLQIILLVIVIGVGIISYYLLSMGTRIVFLNRFESLLEQISKKRSGDKKRIAIDGNDELSMLALAVDKLMLRMEEQLSKNASLYTDSTTDSLTGVANRRYFDEQFVIEWRQAQRHKSQLSIIMLDIDYFKNYNDLYGHVAGDKVLQKLASFIAMTLTRPRDFVARFGGEEFICVLPETDFEGAKKLAEEICKGIADMKLKHEAAGDENIITASLGCLNVQANVELTAQEILQDVDELLYEAKTGGKNKVCAKQRLN